MCVCVCLLTCFAWLTADLRLVTPVGAGAQQLSAGHHAATTTANTPDSTPATPLVTPTSALLQGLINEQRASRSRRAQSEGPPNQPGPLLEHTQAPAPATPASAQQQQQQQPDDDSQSRSDKERKISNALQAGLRQPRDMGVREMDQVDLGSLYQLSQTPLTAAVRLQAEPAQL